MTNDGVTSEQSRASGPPPEEPRADGLLLGIVAVAVAAGVVLRFFPRSGMWLDEALTANIAALELGDIGDALRRDGHPPLYYLLLHLWGSIVGDSDAALRALSGIISTLALPVAYLTGRRLASRRGATGLGAHRTGLIALAVMAVLPFGIRYGTELRMYSLVTLLVGIGYLLVDDLLDADPEDSARSLLPFAAGAAVVAAALLWTHYWSMWLLAAVGLLALWRAVKDPEPVRRTGARLLVAALAVGGLLFLPWVPDLLYQSQHTGTPWGTVYGPASVLVLTVVDFAGARFGIAQLLSYLLVGLATLAAMTAITSRRELLIVTPVLGRVRNEVVILGATLAIGWAASYATDNTYSSRYAAVVFPLFVLCVAAGLAVLRSPRLTAGLLAVIVVAGLWGGASAVRFEWSQTDAIVEAIREDREANGAGDAVIVTCPDQLAVATQRQADRLLDGSIDVIPFPTGGDPRFVDWVDYAERNAAADADAFLEGLGERIPQDATVYFVGNFTYRTFEGRCEQLLAALGQGRRTDSLVERDDDLHDEVANLWAVRPT